MNSLYRLYRPLDFESLLGQDHIREILQMALERDRVSHAYLFTGPRGTGKTSTARILARALNCTAESSKPCNSCEMCLESLQDRLTDVIEIDAASHGLVDDARDLVEKARFLPARAKRKVYIIDEVHMLSKSAFNALLKIIEEPPEHVTFILATTEAHKVLETIRSRCQRFDFHLAEQETIKNVLRSVCEKEGANPTDDGLVLLSQHARGSFRDALSLLEQVIGRKDFDAEHVREVLGLSEDQTVRQFLQFLLCSDQEACLNVIRQLYEQGHDLSEFCQSLLIEMRLILHRSTGIESQKMLSLIEDCFRVFEQSKNPLIPMLPLELFIFRHTTVIPSLSQHPLNINQAKAVAADHLSEKKPVNKIAVEKNIDPEKKSRIESDDSNTSTGASSINDSSSFEPATYISSVKQASLKSLLKYSELSFDSGKLVIRTRSEFERSKLIEQNNIAYLTEVLRNMTGSAATLSVEIDEDAKPTTKSKAGIRDSDLSSVFS